MTSYSSIRKVDSLSLIQEDLINLSMRTKLQVIHISYNSGIGLVNVVNGGPTISGLDVDENKMLLNHIVTFNCDNPLQIKTKMNE